MFHARSSQGLESARGAARKRSAIRTTRGLFRGGSGPLRRFSLRLDDMLVDFSKTRIARETLGPAPDHAGQGLLCRDAPRRDDAGRSDQHHRESLGPACRAPRSARCRHPRRRQERRAGRACRARPLLCLRRRGARRRGARRDRRSHHRRRQYRHRRLGPRPGHGGARACRPTPTARAPISSRMSTAPTSPTCWRGSIPRARSSSSSSKTFTTIETMTNAAVGAAPGSPMRSARRPSATISRRSRPRSSRSRRSASRKDRMFRFWDWVGGRYSMWSAIGLAADDRHRSGALRRVPAGRARRWTSISPSAARTNMPVLMGLVGIWHRNIMGYRARRRCCPTTSGSARFPAYLQQLDMESNGKRVHARRHDGRGRDRRRSSGASPAPTASTPSTSCCTRAPTSSRPIS